MVALVVFAIIGVAIYQILVHTTHSESVGSSVAEAQQNARSALDVILRDLRQAGYGISADDNPPIETASQYRVTFVVDQNDDGVVDPGERITYFVDADQSDAMVAQTVNPDDFVIRRIISSVSDSLANPGAGKGDVVAYGVTQRTAEPLGLERPPLQLLRRRRHVARGERRRSRRRDLREDRGRLRPGKARRFGNRPRGAVGPGAGGDRDLPA